MNIKNQSPADVSLEPWQTARNVWIRENADPDVSEGRGEASDYLADAGLPAEGMPGVTVAQAKPRWLHGKPDPNHHVAVYRDADGRPVGVIDIINDEANGEAGTNIAVDPAYRGMGIAKALWLAVRAAGIDIDTIAPWSGFTKAGAGLAHYMAVERAVAEGKPVPAEVLADYPTLRDSRHVQPIRLAA